MFSTATSDGAMHLTSIVVILIMSMVQVFNYDVACDGLALCKKYTVNMYLIRSRDAPPSMAVHSRNVHLLMVIPGPSNPPNGFSAYTNCILHLFHAYGPQSGTVAAYHHHFSSQLLAMHSTGQ